MKNKLFSHYKLKIAMLILLIFFSLMIGIINGSTNIPPGNVLLILSKKIFNFPAATTIEPIYANLIWSVRLPRVLVAFLVGTALATSGTIMQSIFKNPLASAYTIGVSTGAGFGAILVIISGVSTSILGLFLLPLSAIIFGIMTVLLAVYLSFRIDGQLQNYTIILIGTVFSLFINALILLISVYKPQYAQQIIGWQTGSFALKNWQEVIIITIIVSLCLLLVQFYTKELDILTFGDEQANSLGVNVSTTKWNLIILATVLTGVAVAFVGIIGFVDLISPHIVRRIFGNSHRLLLPISGIFGGCFTVLADVIARTVLAPREVPIGIITALIGAPFFIYVFFSHRTKQTR